MDITGSTGLSTLMGWNCDDLNPTSCLFNGSFPHSVCHAIKTKQRVPGLQKLVKTFPIISPTPGSHCVSEHQIWEQRDSPSCIFNAQTTAASGNMQNEEKEWGFEGEMRDNNWLKVTGAKGKGKWVRGGKVAGDAHRGTFIHSHLSRAWNWPEGSRVSTLRCCQAKIGTPKGKMPLFSASPHKW